MRVVVAPDKFKGSMTAAEAAAALAAGLRLARPDLEASQVPVADGGDGTVAAAVAAGFEPVSVTVDGPLPGQRVPAVLALRDGTAVIELASAAGLRCLPRPGPTASSALTASTYGAGQLIVAALDRGVLNRGVLDHGVLDHGVLDHGVLDHGAGTIVLGIGGSASTDGGAGLVQALGVGLTTSDGSILPRGGAALAGLAAIDQSGLDRRLAGVRVLVASDVDSPLLGPDGAAAVFGPQKGAGPEQVTKLELALARWAELTAAATGRELSAAPGAGAAGGTGFAALSYLGATLVPGVDLVLDLVGFDAALDGSDLVVTGEGCLDRQTLTGKAPLGVARAAARRGVPVVAVAGQVRLGQAELQAAGFSAAYALADTDADVLASMARAPELLAQAGARIASAWPYR